LTDKQRKITLKNKIEILCPSRKCPKCRRFIRYFEDFLSENNIEAEITVITSLKDFISYKTWILPSIFINGKKAGRGYIPEKDKIFSLFEDNRYPIN